MNNHHAWEQEYQKPQFLTLGTEPLSVVKDFCKWLRREEKADIENFIVLDLGCGNGKNVKYLVDGYMKSGIGYDISKTAINEAQKLKGDSAIHYEVRSIDEAYPLLDNSIDLVLDVTSSNALTETGRINYLEEVSRVLKPSGYFFLRALCLDGDANAKNLIKQFPGAEKDTYILGDTGITERAFSKQDLINLYSEYVDIVYLEKISGYQKWGNQSYKRNYWIMYAKMN